MKKPKLNNAHTIIVLAQQKKMGDLRSSAPTTLEPRFQREFFATFLLRGEAGVAPRREMSGARNSSLNVLLLSR